MSLNADEVARASEGPAVLSNKNDADRDHFSTLFVNEDLKTEPEFPLCFHHLSSDSVRLFDNGEDYSFELDVQDSRNFIDSFDANICEYPENEDLNSPVIILYPNVNSEESSPLIASKGSRSKSDRYSVRYSVSESKPLFSDDNCEIDSGQLKSSQVWLNPVQRKIPFVRTSSLGNMSDIVLNTLNNESPLAAIHLAASPSPKSVSNSATEAASSMDFLNSQYTTASNVKPVGNVHPQPCSTCRIYPAAGQEYLSDAIHLTELPKILPQLRSSSQFGCCSTEIPLQPLNQFKTDPQGQKCSDHPCSCTSSFNQSDTSAALNFTSKDTRAQTSHSSSPQEMHVSCAAKNSSCLSGTQSNTSTTVKSTTKDPSQNVQSVLGFGTPVPVSALKQRSKSLPFEGERPLQVFVPRDQVLPHEINKTLNAGNVNTSFISCDHKSCLHNSLFSLYQHPKHDCSYSMRASPAHTDLASTVDSAFQMKNKVHDISARGFIVDETVVSAGDANPTTTTAQTSVQNNFHPTFQSPNYSQNVCSCGNSFAVYVPHNNCNQRTHSDPFTVIGTKENAHIFVAGNPEVSFLEPTCSHVLANAKPNQECFDKTLVLQSRHNGNKNVMFVSNNLSNAAHDICTTEPKEMNNSDSDSECAQGLLLHTNTDNSLHGKHVFQSNDSQVAQYQWLSPTTPLALNFFPFRTKPCRQNLRTNSRGQPGQLDQMRRCNQQPGRRDIRDHGDDISSVQIEENIYRPGMILDVPRSYFDANFTDSQEHLVKSKNGHVRDSMPSSIDSGHPVNKEGSLQRSNTSEFGLLKVNTETTRVPGYSDSRDAPNYSYLCIVATVLNPLFGLAAFLCNHYARKNFRLHRHVQANNLYFASITISTVAIFLTLVGAALLVTHRIVVHSEKKSPTAAPLTESCEGRFFGYDDSLKKFFGIDFNLYCEVTKNEKVMEALKRFWLEDIHNKKKFGKQEDNFEKNNSTQDGQLAHVNATNYVKDDRSLNRDSAGEVFSLNTKAPLGNLDFDEEHSNLDMSGLPQVFKPLTDDKASHNTIVSSSDGPVVPPELEAQYRQYLEGNRRTNVEDILSQEHRSAQPSSFLENEPTTATSNNISSSVTSGEAFEHLVNFDTFMNQKGNTTKEIDV